MIEKGAYGAHLAHHFNLDDYQTLLTRTREGNRVAVTRLRSEAAELRNTTPLEPERAFMVVLLMRDMLDHALRLRTGPVPIDLFPAGSIMMVNLIHQPTARIGGPFESLNFYIPYAALEEISEERGTRRVGSLSAASGRAMRDDVVKHLGTSLIPALENPAETSQLFVDHVSLALVSHVAHAYGEGRADARIPRSTLAPWQERRAKEFMESRLDGGCSLADVARECGLSPSHFARAFRQTTGDPPYRWLLKAKVSHAKRLLLESGLTLSQISSACGFAEQSHFNRTFARFAGGPPGAWRRAHRNK
jgi:AraC-like DNA-binding protein